MRLPTCGILIFTLSGSLGISLTYSVGILNCIQNLTWVHPWCSVLPIRPVPFAIFAADANACVQRTISHWPKPIDCIWASLYLAYFFGGMLTYILISASAAKIDYNYKGEQIMNCLTERHMWPIIRVTSTLNLPTVSAFY